MTADRRACRGEDGPRRHQPAGALSEAVRRNSRTNHGLRTYETFQGAEVPARSGQRAGALRLLREADTMVDHLPPAEELPSAGYWYIPAFFLGQRAFVLDALGDRRGARHAAQESLAELPPAWSRSEWATRRRVAEDRGRDRVV